jgi:F0F1-type ATP synthase membrane subunit b/b'
LPEVDEPEFWELINTIQDEYGLAFVVLFLVFLLFASLFYRLIWKVWSSAMKAKDDEIERLVEERNKYQRLVFDKLLTSVVDDDDSGTDG